MDPKQTTSSSTGGGFFASIASSLSNFGSAVSKSVNGPTGIEIEGLEVVNPEGGTEDAEEEAKKGRWKEEERDSYWKMMQKYVGSDITSMVTLPVIIFEPMTMIQKMAEVSHHPPMSDGHAENEHFTYDVTSKLKTKFLGNSVHVYPVGRTRVTLKRDGVTLDLVPPPTKVSNLIFGRTWIDSPGEMVLTNLTTGDKVVLYFQPCGWFGLSFQGNCLKRNDTKQRPSKQCGGASPAKSQPVASNQYRQIADHARKHHGASEPTWLLALEIVAGTMVGFLFLVAALATVQRCNNKSSIIIPWRKSGSLKDHNAVYIDPEMLKDVRRYSRQELEEACEDFSNIIGSSPDSVVYKGTMKGGPEIAVISLCIKEESWTGYLELYFQREVAELAKLNHENTGKLLGYCRESNPFSRMLVFDYASNGTLHEHLHYYEEGCQFSWTRRMKIVIGIVRGLKYLHTEVEPPFTISELNSSAVYLTEEFSPKLVDFESWKTILERSEKNSGTISSQGAVCVLPNSLEARHLDTKGNVHAFGVLLLEIISGRLPHCKEKGYLVDWAKYYLEKPELMSHLVNPELKNFRHDDLKVICEVIALCINPDTSARPSMRELYSMLESRIDKSVSVDLKSSSLAWAELALLS